MPPVLLVDGPAPTPAVEPLPNIRSSSLPPQPITSAALVIPIAQILVLISLMVFPRRWMQTSTTLASLLGICLAVSMKRHKVSFGSVNETTQICMHLAIRCRTLLSSPRKNLLASAAKAVQ
jgi:hypothetical protein